MEMERVEAEQAVTVSLDGVVTPIWTGRKRIIQVAAGLGLLTLAINFLLPVYYKSTATLLPETDKGKLPSLSQFAGIAQLAGVNISGSEVSRLYPTILTSDAILGSVIALKYKTQAFPDSVNLVQYFDPDEDTEAENFETAVRDLRELTTVTYESKTGFVTITLEMTEPELAADVVNAMVDQLDQFMRLKKITSASEQRKWIETRLREVVLELRVAEDSLKVFREKNRRVVDSPRLVLEQERLVRDVQVKSTIFVELKKQAELAKIEEIKNISIVNVLDRGRVPVKKSRPNRLVNTAIVFFLALFGTSGLYAAESVYGEKVRGSLASLRRTGNSDGKASVASR